MRAWKRKKAWGNDRCVCRFSIHQLGHFVWGECAYYSVRDGGSGRMLRCEKKKRGWEIIASVVFSFTSWAILSGESARTIG